MSDYRRTVLSGTLRGDTCEKKLEANEYGELLAAQGLPPYVEMARLGGGFSLIATTAVAALVVRPSTVAALTLWNGEAATGKSYVIDRAFTHCLVSGAESGRFGIWLCLHPSGTARPGDTDITASATNFTGNTGKTYNGLAACDVGDTVVDNGWFPWGNSADYELTGVLPGASIDADVGGRLIVPPSGAISITVVGSMADATFCSGFSWYEVVLDLQ